MLAIVDPEFCFHCNSPIGAITKDFVWYECGRVITKYQSGYSQVELFDCDEKKHQHCCSADQGRRVVRTFQEYCEQLTVVLK